jgi:hypothetical protein
VEVKVQFSVSTDAAPPAALRGKLADQQMFPLVNTGPITITMQPADGWTVRPNEKEVRLLSVINFLSAGSVLFWGSLALLTLNCVDVLSLCLRCIVFRSVGASL